MSFEPIYQLAIEYVSDDNGVSLTHQHNINVALADGQPAPQPGAAPSGVLLKTSDGSGGEADASLQAAATVYINALIAFISDECTVTSAALLFYPEGPQRSAIYISIIDLADTSAFPSLEGTSAENITPGSQVTVTFFDGRGKVSRLVLIEARPNLSDRQVGLGALGVEETAFVNALTAVNSPVRGAAGSRYLGFRLFSETINEATYRARFRQG